MIKDQQYRILHLEDLPSDATLVEREIKKTLKNYSIHVVETETDFIKELEGFKPHIVISDYILPSFDGLSALKIVLEKTPITPVIILTGSMNEDTAGDCMKAGAADYVIKEHIKRLGAAVLNALEQKEIKIEKIRADKQILLLSKSIEQSPVCVVLTDHSGKIEYINKKFSELTGYSFDEAIGQNPRILKSGKQSREYYEQMWQTILSGHDWKGEMHNKRKNGELYWESVSISSIANEKGVITHFIGVKEDITEKKQTLQELVTAKEKAEESDKLKTAFLQNMSHEIRTPMNAIVGFSELLELELNNPVKLNYYTKVIRKRADDLLGIINELLDIARIEAGQLNFFEKQIDINILLDEIQSFYSEHKILIEKSEIKLILKEIPKELNPIISTDSGKLKQIFFNLIHNAFKFTNQGKIEFGYHSINNDGITFFVSDTGVGISDNMKDLIFERFRKSFDESVFVQDGLGLGLAIVKGLLKLFNGKIWVESEPNKGSTFYFTIPYITASLKSHIESQSLKSIYDWSNFTILIVEDDTFNVNLFEELLQHTKIKYLVGTTGQEAISIFTNNPNIDLVLMDIKLPDMSGYEVTQSFKKLRPKIPIIAQTAYASENDKRKCIEVGCIDFITKPFKQELLISKIMKQLADK